MVRGQQEWKYINRLVWLISYDEEEKMMRIEFLYYSKLMNSIVLFLFFCFFHLSHAACGMRVLLSADQRTYKKILLSQFDTVFPSCHIQFVKKLNGFHQNGDWIECFYASFISITRLDLCLLPSPCDTITVNNHGFNRLLLLQQKIKKEICCSRSEHRLWFDR